jgi:hypothetical protein
MIKEAKAKADAFAKKLRHPKKAKDGFVEIKKTVQAEVCFWAPV